MNDFNEFNKKVIEEFRANKGKVGGPFEGAPILLLHTTGAKSGKTRINPLVYGVDGDQYVIIASKAGAPTNPDWYHNIVANPSVKVEIGEEQFEAEATVAPEPKRTHIFTQIAKAMPNFAEYQKGTDRIIPVVILRRR